MEIDRTALRDDSQNRTRETKGRRSDSNRGEQGTRTPTELPGRPVVTPSCVECRPR